MLAPRIYNGTAFGLLSIASLIEESDRLDEAKQAAALGTFNLQSYVKGAYAIYVKVPNEVDAKGWKYYAMPTTAQGKAAIGKMLAKDPAFLDNLPEKALASIKTQVGDFAAWQAEVNAVVAAEKAKPAGVSEPPLEFLAPELLAKMLSAQFDKAGTTAEKAAADPVTAAALAKIYGDDWVAKYSAGKEGKPYSKAGVPSVAMPAVVVPSLKPEPVVAPPVVLPEPVPEPVVPPAPPPPDPAEIQALKVAALKPAIYNALGSTAYTPDPEAGLAYLKIKHPKVVAKLAADDPEWEQTYKAYAVSTPVNIPALWGTATPAALVADVQAYEGGFAYEVELYKAHGADWEAKYGALQDAASKLSNDVSTYFQIYKKSLTPGQKMQKWAEFIDAVGGPAAVAVNPLLNDAVLSLTSEFGLGEGPGAWKTAYDDGAKGITAGIELKTAKVTALKAHFQSLLGFQAYTDDPDAGLYFLKQKYPTVAAHLAEIDPDWEKSYADYATSGPSMEYLLAPGDHSVETLVQDAEKLAHSLIGKYRFSAQMAMFAAHGAAWEAEYDALRFKADEFEGSIALNLTHGEFESEAQQKQAWAAIIDALGGREVIADNPITRRMAEKTALEVFGAGSGSWDMLYLDGKEIEAAQAAKVPEPVADEPSADTAATAQVAEKLSKLLPTVDFGSFSVATSKEIVARMQYVHPLLAADLASEIGAEWTQAVPNNGDAVALTSETDVAIAAKAMMAAQASKEQAALDSFEKMMTALYPAVPFDFTKMDPHAVVQNMKDLEPDLVATMEKEVGPNWDQWFIQAHTKKHKKQPPALTSIPVPSAPPVAAAPAATPAPAADAPAAKGLKVAAWIGTQFPGADLASEAAALDAPAFQAALDALTVVAPDVMAGVEAEFGADWKDTLKAWHQSIKPGVPTVVTSPVSATPSGAATPAPAKPMSAAAAVAQGLELNFAKTFAHPKLAELYNALLASTAATDDNDEGFAWGLEAMISSDEAALAHAQSVFGSELGWDVELRAAIKHMKKKKGAQPLPVAGGTDAGVPGVAPTTASVSTDTAMQLKFDKAFAVPAMAVAFNQELVKALEGVKIGAIKDVDAAVAWGLLDRVDSDPSLEATVVSVYGTGTAAKQEFLKSIKQAMKASGNAPLSIPAKESPETEALVAKFKEVAADPKVAALYNKVLQQQGADKSAYNFSSAFGTALEADSQLYAQVKAAFGVGEDGAVALLKAIIATRKKLGTTPLPVAGVPVLLTPAAAMLGVLPDAGSLTYAGNAKNVGGAGEKSFYKGTDGKTYLFKNAVSKSSGAAKPHAAVAQEISAQVGLAVKPKSIPAKMITLGDQVGTIQPWLGDNITTMKSVAPGALSDTEQLDVAAEHVIDWVTSNHDSHGGNMLRLPHNAGVVGVDKEQAFRFFKTDKLSVDYAPNDGEAPPYYNQFWKDWVADKPGVATFDPQKLLSAIESVEKIDDAAYTALLQKYYDALPADAKAAQPNFVKAALARKQNVRKDFETFITDLYKKKKKKPVGSFTFAGGWKEGTTPTAPAVGATPAPVAAGTYAAPAPVAMPSPFYAQPWASWNIPINNGMTLTDVENTAADVAVLGGTKAKHILKGPGGAQFLLKPTPTDTARAEAAVAVSKIASLLGPPGSYVPVKSLFFYDKSGAFVKGSVQPMVANVGTLQGKDIKNLTAKQIQQLQRERVLDWLVGNHDTKGANFVVTPDGDIVGVDKERAFKPFMAATTTGSKKSDDVLNLGYAAPGITPPIYNALYMAYVAKQIELNPMDVLPVIEQIEKIPEKTYKKLITPYIEALATEEGWGASKKKAVFNAIMDRKKNIRADFEQLFTNIRVARGEPGEFKFTSTVVTPKVTTAAPAPAAPAVVVPPAPGSSSAAAAAIQAAHKQAQEKYAAAQAAYTQELAKHKETVAALNAAAVAETPPGLSPPPAGKKWELLAGKSALATALAGGGVTETPFLVKGVPDPTSPNITLKFSSKKPVEAEAFLKANGVDAVSVKSGSNYAAIAVVPKAQLASAKLSTTKSWTLTDIPMPPVPTPPTPPGPPPKTLTPYEVPAFTADVPSVAEIGSVETDKNLKSGKAFRSDGGAVEGQFITAKRYIDENGKEYYQFLFKVRPEGAALMQGGTNSAGGDSPGTYKDDPNAVRFLNATYDPEKDAYVATSKENSNAGAFAYTTSKYNDAAPGRTWQSPDGNSTLAKVSDTTSKYAYRNYVLAKVYPQPGEAVDAAFARVLALAGDSFADKVLATPNDADVQRMRLARLFWSLAPQASDGMKDADKTVENLTTQLKKLGVTEAQLASIQDVEVAPGVMTSVLPGRGDAIAKKGKVHFLTTGVSNPKNAALTLKGQLAGVMQRNLNGVPAKGASYNADVASGGGDQVYCRVMDDKFATGGVGGDITIVLHPSEMDRLDAYYHDDDSYGCCNVADSNGYAWSNRKPLEQALTKPEGVGYGNEIMFRRAVRPDSIVKISCASASLRVNVIAACKEEGITQVRGIPIEDFVVVASSMSELYKDHMKATGY